MNFQEWLKEAKSDIKLVDDVVKALDEIGVSTKVYDGGENFNVSFKADGTEYYVRPNDQDKDLFYIDADIDDFDSFQVKDLSALKKKVTELVGEDK